MVTVPAHTAESIKGLLHTVMDPEIPVISIVDLGIVRSIEITNDTVHIVITPTYSGCPAMRVIEDDIRTTLKNNGIEKILIDTVFAPAWTTDWISAEAKERLKAYGIAPPDAIQQSPLLKISLPKVPCPSCGSRETEVKSEFGSTACKAFYYCRSCALPFEYFKPH